MAYEIPVQNLSLIAAADLSTHQYKAVKVDAAGKIALAGAGENAIGILQDDPGSGKIGSVMVYGVSKAVYGGVVTAGDNLSSDALGRLITTVAPASVIGVALESGVLGETHTVFLSTKTSSGTNTTKSVLSFNVPLATLVTGDVITEFVPGFAGTIEKISVAVTTVTTDVDADATINAEIGVTNTTGGVVTIDDANMAVQGAVVDGTAITGNNTFTATDAISIEAVVTNAFTDGEITILLVLS